ncbi:MAG: AAA family ATPase [Lachnospiraceae bacterium]|nr:AAA family ATPase [Lachnospiraceae bacterium]
MNIKRAKQEIKDTIEAYLLKDEYGEYVIPQIRQRPVLLLGAPGIGKTQIMEQISRECQVGLVSYTITHHTRQSAIGLPFISKKEFGGKEYSVTEYTMSEIVASIYNKIEKTGLKEGILFIDEINCVSETLAPAMLQFLQCKMFGNHEIPQGWVIVAAGNPPEYNKSVREFDVVTMDRVKKIEVEPDFAVWKEYAVKNQLHPAVISYLSTRTANFYRMETTVDGKTFATPRGWEDLSQMLMVYEKLDKKMDREVVRQYIQHEKIAKDFANYLELYEKYQMDYQLEAVLSGEIDDALKKKASHASFDEKLSVVSLLLSRIRNAFADVLRGQEQIDLLYGQLKELREGLTEENQTNPMAFVRQTTEAFARAYETKKKAELLTRLEDRIYRDTLKLLEKDVWNLAQEGSGAEVLEKIRDWFGKLQDRQEQEESDASQMLEYAFDFMEEVFGSGQEMVIFVTELNSDYYTVQFLQQYECERYYRYNRQLLVDESSQAIEEQLRQMGR